MDNNLVDIVRQIIDSINLEIPVKSVASAKVYLCDTMHITIGKIIKDEYGNEYKVIDFSFNEWIEVEPYNHNIPFSGTIVVAPSILFLHGTPSSTNNEYLVVSQRTLNKTPFIWLLVSYEYDNLPLNSSVVASYKARLFFMDWANTPKWSNDNHNDLVIKPMENLSNAFIKVIEDNYTFKRLDGFTRRPRPRFGVEITNKGSDKTIIHEDLSGIDLSVTLEMYDTKLCC
jgi:hypothetical protein